MSIPRRTLLRWLSAGVGAWLLGAGSGCAAGDAKPQPDVLLITVDTLRADHVGAYGFARPTTPVLDRLAREGALFEVAYAPMGTTSPAHATLFTGRQPIEHGLVRNGLALPPEDTTLAEILAERGYATAAFVSSFPVSRRFGFDRGFEHFDDHFEAKRSSLKARQWVGHPVHGRFDRPGDATADAALAWLAQREDPRPLFLWVHLFDPHYPHVAPERIERLFPAEAGVEYASHRAGYQSEVRFADEQMGRIVEAFESQGREPPLVVVTSDHGEGLHDHGWAGHNRYLYEEELRIPLVFHWRGRIPAGLRLQQPAHLVDLPATLAGLLGLDAREALPGGDGVDLSPQLAPEGRPPPDLERALWLQRPFYGANAPRPEKSPELAEGYGFGIRQGRWKYTEGPGKGRRALFDLRADPEESTSLVAQERDRARRLSARLEAWSAPRVAAASPADEPPSPEDLEALRALGYAE